jgi:DNA repair exonuclease SbcCD ATPase subunit
MESGLSRIILIDALREGLTCDIPLSGHTNLTGFNDVGKTTLIKLGPIFYGESPLSIGIKKKAGRSKSFAGWYLPRVGSSIVYEYLREGKKRCLWFHGGQSDQDSFVRVFIEHEFQYDLFVNPENRIPYSPNDVKKTFQLKGIYTYQCSSFEEHREILLDGKNRLTQFAIVPPRTRLSKLTSLFSGMLTRNTKFDELCKIIEGWCKGDIESSALKNLQQFKLDKSSLIEWKNDYYALYLIKKNINLFKELGVKLSEFKEAKNELASFYHQAISKVSHLTNKLAQDKSSYSVFMSEIESELSALDSSYISQLGVVKSNLAVCTEITGKKDNLQARYDDFMKRLGKEPELQLINLSKYKSKYTATQQQISFATSAVDGIGEWYQKQKGDLSNKYRKLENDLGNLQGRHFQEKSDWITKQRKINSEEINELKEKQSIDIRSLEEELAQLEKSEFIVSQAIKTPVADEALFKAIESLQSLKKESEQVATEAHSKNVTSRKKIEDLEEQLKDAKSALNLAEDEEELIRIELERYQSVKEAKDGSLLSFLKSNIDGWEDSFGRLIDLKILNNKTLNPELTQADPASVFGVSLDVTKLPLADFPSEEVLIEKINQLSIKLKNITSEIDKRDKEYGKLYEAIMSLKSEIGGVETAYNQAILKGRRLQQQLDDHTNEVEQQKASFIEAKQAEHNEIKVLLTCASEKLKHLKDKQSTKLETLSQSHDSILIKSTNEWNQKIRSIDEQKRQLTHQEQNELIELDKSRDAKLSDAGVDATFIKTKSTELDEIKAKIEKLESLKSLFDAFTVFKESEYAELPAIQEKLDKINEKHRQSINQLNAIKTQVTILTDKKVTKTNQFTNSKQVTENDISRLSNQIINIATYKHEVEHYVESGSIQQLLRGFSERTKSVDGMKQLMSANVGHLRGLFQEHSGTSPHSYWIADSVDINDIEGTAAKLVNYIDRELLNKDIRMLVDGLGQLEKIRTYCSYLEDFEQRVNSFSRRLGPYLEKGSNFHGLERLGARIIFNLSETQAWEDIKNLTSQFESWRDNVGVMHSTYELDTDLPPESFVDALEQFTNAKNVEDLGIDDMYKYIEFRIDLVDKGEVKRLRSHTDFGDVSSNGTSYLIMLVLFISFIKMHRKEANVNFVWALDELTNIDSENIHTLFDLLNDSNISLLSACPEVNHAIFHRFANTRRLSSNGTGHLEILDVTKNTDHSWINEFVDGGGQ